MTDTGVTLTKNDGSEQFTLKVNNVTMSNSSNVIVKSIISAAGELAGTDPVLAKETYELSGDIRGMDGTDYPNSGVYSDDDFGMTEELRRAAKQWGPDTNNGLDTLDWDGRTIDVVISEIRIDQNRNQDPEKQYSFTLELTTYDVYTG